MAVYACERGGTQRRASYLCSTARSAFRYISRVQQSNRHLAKALQLIARGNPAWGYRLSCGALRLRAWKVNQKRVYRLWYLLGLSLPPYKPSRKIKSGQQLDNPAQKKNDVWAWDLVHDSYGDAKKFRCLTVKDEATGYCLEVEVGISIRNGDIQQLLKSLISRYGRPKAIRSDNGAELIADDLQRCIKKEGIRRATIDPEKPWQNGSNESLNGTFRNECLDAELFGSLMVAKVVIADWRRRYNQLRPHSSQGYITPEMAYFPKHANREKLTT